MKAQQIFSRLEKMKAGLALSVVAILAPWSGWAQVLERVPAELVQYPDMIVHNGKIVTVDDHSFSASPGTQARAMAIRGGNILAVGSNDQVLRLGGPQTKVIDLRGRAVLPGLVSAHEHPYAWFWNHEAILEKVFGDDSLIISRVLHGSIDEQLKAFEPTL